MFACMVVSQLLVTFSRMMGFEYGVSQAAGTLARSVASLLGRVDKAARAGTSGEFFDIDGAEAAFYLLEPHEDVHQQAHQIV